MSIETKGSPLLAPEYALHRYVSGANDTLPEIVKKHGMNMAGHRFANIQIVPVDGASPDLKILWWSDEAAQFIEKHVGMTFASKGVDTPWEMEIETNGRIIFVAVINGVTAGQKVRVFVSGFGVGAR